MSTEDAAMRPSLPRTARHVVAGLLLLFVTLPLLGAAEVPEKDVLQVLEEREAEWGEPSVASLCNRAKARSAEQRLGAATRLAGKREPEAKTCLEELLKDPDALVRRVAAASLWSEESAKPEKAKACRYEEVLEAEGKAREILKRILTAEPEKQFELTQQLIALGWPALSELRHHKRDKDRPVAFSAAYACQEIEARAGNVLPAWAVELDRKLKQKVTFDFQGELAEQVLRKLSEKTGVRICPPDLDGTERKRGLGTITLRVTEMELGTALAWIGKLMENQYKYKSHDGAIMFWRDTVLVDGVGLVFVDLRDLEAAGLKPNWEEFIKTKVEKAWWFDDLMFGGPITKYHGILAFYAPNYGGQWDERRQSALVSEFLDQLREERGLPKVGWPVPKQ
jgi:hypothetical protein